MRCDARRRGSGKIDPCRCRCRCRCRWEQPSSRRRDRPAGQLGRAHARQGAREQHSIGRTLLCGPPPTGQTNQPAFLLQPSSQLFFSNPKRARLEGPRSFGIKFLHYMPLCACPPLASLGSPPSSSYIQLSYGRRTGAICTWLLIDVCSFPGFPGGRGHDGSLVVRVPFASAAAGCIHLWHLPTARRGGYKTGLDPTGLLLPA